MKIFTFFFLLITVGNSFGQNEFLSRDYWKEKPSIETIKSDKKKKENDITALNSYNFDAVCWALLEGVDFEIIQYLLKQKGNGVDKITHDQRTYLFWAAYKGRTDVMKYLLEKGADVNVKDQFGYSVINFASTTGQLNTKVYDILIDAGRDIKTEKMESGANPILLIMPHIKDVNELDYFLNKGLQLDSKDNKGNNAITYASLKGNKKVIEYLISKGIAVQDNALFYASKGARRFDNNVDFFKFLSEKGADVNVTNDKGENLFFKLAGNKHALDIANFLLNNKVVVDKKNNNGITAIFNAVKRDDVALVEFFLNQKGNTNLTDKDKNNLLHIASQELSVESLKKLLKYSKDGINSKNADGYTPLLIASMKAQDAKILELLIQNGANKNVSTEFGETPFDLAKSNEILSEKKVNIDFLK